MLVVSGALTALPLIGFAYAVRRVPLSVVGLLQYIAPTMQFLLGVFVFHEPSIAIARSASRASGSPGALRHRRRAACAAGRRHGADRGEDSSRRRASPHGGAAGFALSDTRTAANVGVPLQGRFRHARLPLSRLVLAACLAFVAVAEVCAQGITRVYRADPRAPDDVFFTGFAGRGNSLDVLGHALGGTCDARVPDQSAFVSLTYERREAVGFARDHLDAALPAHGPSTTRWLYTIRTDQTYMEVDDLLGQAVAAGRNSSLGYTPGQAAVLETIRRTTVIATEAQVFTLRVDPENIVSAQALYYTESGDLYEGPVIQQSKFSGCQHGDRQRRHEPQTFVPARPFATAWWRAPTAKATAP
jgi:hypothetical protein